MGVVATERVRTAAPALAHAQRLLAADPALAVEQLLEILRVIPDQADARRMLGHAYRALGDQFTLSGERQAADRAYAESIRASVSDPRLMEAATALCDGRVAIAERLLRAQLKLHPTDVAAIRMLAEVAARIGRNLDAEKLLSRALELSPSFEPARHNYALVLFRQQKGPEALEQIDLLLKREPGNISYRALKAATLARIGEYEAAIELYAGILKERPSDYRVWMSYGHTLRTAGRQQECVEAYRKCAALNPAFGEVWWSLANLKTLRFSDGDIAAMTTSLQSKTLSDEDRYHLHFALGKALEDEGRYAESFSHYDQANRRRRASLHYDAKVQSEFMSRSQALYTQDLFAAREGYGSTAGDPIFIVGLPRAGSTLIEQILASHSQVEGTMELPDITLLAREIADQKAASGPSGYPEAVAGMSADQLRALGELYLSRTRVQRKTGRPFFIDKMPNNFAHIGLIHLILPNAKIIDARRNAMANCFSAFKQHFARGQGFSYDLTELGTYYREYVELMAHFDDALPGRVHRVVYEEIVSDTEREVRRLLAYCGLPFEDACLRFNETERAVRTASSEQVRRPIFTNAVDQWRNYEPWLGELRKALGPIAGDQASP